MQQKLTHGGDWAGFEAEYGRPPLDFSANVSPLGVPGAVRRAVAKAAGQAARYPDPLCRQLTEALARHEHVKQSQILCGNGAADLIFRAVLAKKPRTALVTAPTFAEYGQALSTVDCRVEQYLLTEENGFAVTPAILDRITPELDMLFLCEPNNPTGALTDLDLLRRILQQCADCGTLLVVDECFNDWLDDPAAHTLKGELDRFPNLLILKAFTKLYAMAGLRLGYCLCGDEALLAAMTRCGQPWSVSGPAQQAGIAALGQQQYVARLRALIQKERPWLSEQLAGLGLRVLPGSANYLLLYSEKELAAPMRALGVLIRDCSNYPGLGTGWYRVAVRTRRENRQLIAALRKVCSNG